MEARLWPIAQIREGEISNVKDVYRRWRNRSPVVKGDETIRKGYVGQGHNATAAARPPCSEE